MEHELRIVITRRKLLEDALKRGWEYAGFADCAKDAAGLKTLAVIMPIFFLGIAHFLSSR